LGDHRVSSSATCNTLIFNIHSVRGYIRMAVLSLPPHLQPLSSGLRFAMMVLLLSSSILILITFILLATTNPGATVIMSTQPVTTNPMQFVQHACSDSSFTGEDIVTLASTTLQRLSFPISAANSFTPATVYWIEFNAASQVDFWGASISNGKQLLRSYFSSFHMWLAFLSSSCSYLINYPRLD
jgi:hypothetical protein